MKDLKKRVVIKYFHLKSLTPKEIKEKMDNTLKDSAPSYLMIKRWVAVFKMGRTNTSDEPRSRRPVMMTTPETIEKIHRVVLEDRRLKLFKIAEAVNISKERAGNILNNFLAFHKVCARWLPRL